MVAKERLGHQLEPVKQVFSPRAPTFDLDYSHVDAPANSNQNIVVFAISQCRGRYQSLLTEESFSVTIRVRWVVPTSGTFIMGYRSAGLGFRPWGGLTGIRFILEEVPSTTDGDPNENLIVANLPSASWMPYRTDGAVSIENAPNILLSVPLLQKWYGTVSGDPLLIEISANENWDYDPSDGIDSDKQDFQGAFMHELGHALGFTSGTGRAASLRPTIFDVFRLPNLSRPVDPGEFLGEPRELRTGQAASAILSLSSDELAFPMAAGTTSGALAGQPSHWVERFSLFSDYIGLMDVSQQNGENLVVNGSYLQNSDIFAIDLIGFNIDYDNVVPPALPAPILLPAPSDVIVRRTNLPIEWGPGSFAESYTAIVQDLGPSGTATPTTAFRVDDINTQTTTVPRLSLTPGNAYRLRVLSNNWRGFATTLSTFRVACYCDYDDGSGTGTPDGGVAIEDLLYYLVLFDTGAIAADLDDGSGTGTPDDGIGIEELLFFLARFELGC